MTRENARQAEEAYSRFLDLMAERGETHTEEYKRTYRLWEQAFKAFTDGRL